MFQRGKRKNLDEGENCNKKASKNREIRRGVCWKLYISVIIEDSGRDIKMSEKKEILV